MLDSVACAPMVVVIHTSRNEEAKARYSAATEQEKHDDREGDDRPITFIILFEDDCAGRVVLIVVTRPLATYVAVSLIVRCCIVLPTLITIVFESSLLIGLCEASTPELAFGVLEVDAVIILITRVCSVARIRVVIIVVMVARAAA